MQDEIGGWWKENPSSLKQTSGYLLDAGGGRTSERKFDLLAAARDQLEPFKNASPKEASVFKALDSIVNVASAENRVTALKELGVVIKSTVTEAIDTATAEARREKALSEFVGTPQAKERFEKAITRAEQAQQRKAEVLERAERIKQDPQAELMPDGTRVKTTHFEVGPIARVEEHSTGKKVTTHETEYPVSSDVSVEEANGTRIKTERRSTDAFGEGERIYSEIEHTNGALESETFDDHYGQYDTTSGRILHADGSAESWTDDTLDFSTHRTVVNKNGMRYESVDEEQ